MKIQSDTQIALSQANFLGQGFDITGKSRIPDSLIQPLLDPTKVGTTTFQFLGRTYQVPVYVDGAEDTAGVYFEDTTETRESLQNSLSVNAGVSVSYGAFSGQMEAAYGREFSQSSEYFYSYRNFHARMAVLSLRMGEAMKALSDQFIAAYEALPDTVTPENLGQFADFFDQFGFYFTSRVSLGATLEYYVGVSKQSQLSTSSISASVKAEYKGLFFSGGVSADIKKTEQFQSYSANRTVNIFVQGGDPSLIAKLGNVDPDNPNPASVDAYNQWLDTIDTDPAIADFYLTGIWRLIPDAKKAAAVQEAFTTMRDVIRPRMVIEATSTRYQPPVITVGALIRPSEPPAYPSGFQLVIFDRRDISRTGVVYDKYYGVSENAEYQEYEAMYDAMARDIQATGFDDTQHVLVLASYGMSTNAPPNYNMYSLLRAAGGGAQLQGWVDVSDPGSDMSGWPGSYIQVGVLSLGPDTGVDLLRSDAVGPAPLLQEVFFYRQRGSELYTLSAGRSEGGTLWVQTNPVRRAYRVQGSAQAYAGVLDTPAL